MGLLEAAPDAILLVRAGGVIALVNGMAERLFGYDRSELIGQPVEMLVPMAYRAGHGAIRERYEHAPRVRPMGLERDLEGVRKNGEHVPVEISLSPVETPIGRLTIAIVRDVTNRRQLEQRLRHASTHDGLTGLYNRGHLDDTRAALEASAEPVAVVLLDVDGLKEVNDRLGHEAGDQLLRRAAVVLRSVCGPNDVAVRLGGDEFALLIPGADESTTTRMLVAIESELAQHNEIHRGTPLAISMGAGLTTKRGGIGQAMRVADQRMYAQKRRRRSLQPPR